MAKEPDQTRWVGIRPTDPSENIPVDIVASTGCAKVEPCAAGTEFKTLTKKRTPAISDLQAVKERYGTDVSIIGVNCSVSGSVSLPAVTAGEIWVVTNITAINETKMCDIIIRPQVAGGFRIVKGIYSVAPGIIVSWSGILVLKNPDLVRCYFELGGVADTIKICAVGYKIGVY